MRKTYVSRASKMQIVIEAAGVRKSIPFAWDVVSKGGAIGCSYTTDDEAEQKGIETHEFFGKRIHLSEETQRIVAEMMPKEEKAYTIAEARKILREQYGKRGEETRTKVQVQTLMNEIGLKSAE